MGKNILLTGGIGSGKSTCVKVFELLGVPIFHDDAIARNISNVNSDVKSQIKLLFGDDIYNNDMLDRQRVAALVFTDKSLLKALSSAIHPAVQKAYLNWIAEHSTSPYTLRESALATNDSFNFDSIISVSAPLDLRIKRVAKRDDISEKEILERISNQISQEERNRTANFLILCNDEMLVIPQIITIHNKFLNI